MKAVLWMPQSIYLWMRIKKYCHVTAQDVADQLKSIVNVLGKNYLGFGPDRVGTHSIRASFAMMLKLKGHHPSTIMLQGRWSSDAFMKYIRPQIQQFSTGLSSVMVEDDFFTIPESSFRSQADDPGTSKSGNLSASAPFYGPLSNRTALARSPVFDVWS